MNSQNNESVYAVISQFTDQQGEVRDLEYKLKVARVQLRATAKVISESRDFSRALRVEAQAILEGEL